MPLKLIVIILLMSVSSVQATTRYVGKTNASDSGTCTNQSTPCATIQYGISQMIGGDTLIVGNGTYTGSSNIVRDPPNGSSGAYTTIQAETDFGVLLDGSSWGNNSWVYGIRIDGRSYIKVQGFRVDANQNDTGGPITLGTNSHHIKIIRCGFWGGPVNDNGETAGTGPNTDYILFEECYAFGGGRSGFTAYWSDHTIFRRCVSRQDYNHFDLQSSGFTNYDSSHTVFQNNIAIDSNSGAVPSPSLALYSSFFFENKSDHEPNTSIEMHGNIALNYKAYYGGIYDQVPADARIFKDNIIWDTGGGFQAATCDTGECNVAPTWDIERFTVGETANPYDHWDSSHDHDGTYGGGDGLGGAGTGASIYGNYSSSVTDSIFVSNGSYGVADYVDGDYNAFYDNGANYGGVHTATPGTNDITSHDILWSVTNTSGSLKYLPKGAESGSYLEDAGATGGPVGAQVMWKIGVDGTLYGETGWNTVRSPDNGYGGTDDRLWPFPNEDQIKGDMASYSGGGLDGERGFTVPTGTATQLDGTSEITLTSYIWEYLGNEMPDLATVYGTATPVNGVCGSNDGATLYSLSTADPDNCTTGAEDSFSGTGPWTWDCLGADGGADDSCSASLASASVSKISGIFVVGGMVK